MPKYIYIYITWAHGPLEKRSPQTQNTKNENKLNPNVSAKLFQVKAGVAEALGIFACFSDDLV